MTRLLGINALALNGRPNGLPLSRRERWKGFQKSNDLVREAVGYSGLFGRSRFTA